MLGHSPIASAPIGALRRYTAADARRDLAQRIRAHRIARGWTQRDIASRAGMAFETYRLFERTGRISLERFLRLLDLLGHLDSVRIPMPETRSIDDVVKQVPRAPRQRVRAPRRHTT